MTLKRYLKMFIRLLKDKWKHQWYVELFIIVIFINLYFQGPWDQEKFEQLIVDWIVACDQPFSEVDKTEFRAILNYAHHPSTNLKIPHRNAIKHRIMQMGEDNIELTSVWKSSLKTGKKPGLDQTKTGKDRKLVRPVKTETMVWSSVHHNSKYVRTDQRPV